MPTVAFRIMNDSLFKPRNHPTSGQVIGAAIEVHRQLGPGLLESVYEECLARELAVRGLSVERQRLVPVTYKGYDLGIHLRIDLIVRGEILVEIKSVERLAPVHTSQVRTYLTLTGLQAGLILNFNSEVMREGIRRVVV
jgi:GxxExxY protein